MHWPDTAGPLGRVLGLSLAIITVAAWHVANEPRQVDALQETAELSWYRGNMHTHSLWSDGDDFLENIGLWYRERGYHFLVISDHNTLDQSERWIDVAKLKDKQAAFEKLQQNWPRQVDQRIQDGRTEVRLQTFAEVATLVGVADQFLMIQGEEITDKFGRLPLHLNAHHLRELIPPQGGSSVTEVLQNNVNAVIAQRERTGQPMIVHVNHPNYQYGVTAEDLMAVEGENFFEVYNGHPTVNNSGDHQHASTERMWDIINTRRLTEFGLPLLYGLATDDGHSYHHIPSRASEPGRGWVMVLAKQLSPEALIQSLEAGRFYSSSGVTLDRVAANEASIEIVIREEPGVSYVTEFIGTRKGFDRTSQPVVGENGEEIRATRLYSNDIGQVLARGTAAKVRYHFDGDELFVRARITSSRLHPNPSEPGDFEQAWTQPVRGPAAL